jgi:hypothetical protein
MSLVQPFCYYEETLTAFSIEQAILTYPFTVSHEHLDGAAVACNLRTQGLRSAIVKQAPTNMLSIYITDTNSHRRVQSQVTITEGILNSRLKKGKWLNGDLIVFCLLWYVHEGIICVFKLHPGGLTLSILYRITRKQVEEEASSSPTLAPFAFYDDNMYTAWITCSQTKVKQVQHLFDRTFVLIPVCDQGHWSLIVICNPRIFALRSQNKRASNDSASRIRKSSFILHLDSYNKSSHHSELIHLNILSWLNERASEEFLDLEGTEPFNVSSMPLAVPKGTQTSWW